MLFFLEFILGIEQGRDWTRNVKTGFLSEYKSFGTIVVTFDHISRALNLFSRENAKKERKRLEKDFKAYKQQH